jgi:hypothetical protein
MTDLATESHLKYDPALDSMLLLGGGNAPSIQICSIKPLKPDITFGKRSERWIRMC